jgi:uncharacterized phage-associated protein
MSSVALNPSGDNRQPRRRPIFNAYAVANWFLHHTITPDTPITLERLQKLVCLSYGWFAVYQSKALFDDKIVMSRSGAAVLSLERMFERFGSRPITRYAQVFQDDEIEVINFSIHPEQHEWFSPLPLKEKQRLRNDERDVQTCLYNVWKIFGNLSNHQLLTAVCCPDSDMYAVYTELKHNTEHEYLNIPDALLYGYFQDFFATLEQRL